MKRVILDDGLRVESYDIIDLTKPVSFLYEKKKSARFLVVSSITVILSNIVKRSIDLFNIKRTSSYRSTINKIKR